MDYKFLDKVIDQLVRETEIDHDKVRIKFPSLPFFYYPFLTLSTPHYQAISNIFYDHCENVYGLNKDEVEYIWKKYKKIIKDKIGNG